MPFPPVGVFAGQGIHDAVESQAGVQSQGSPEVALNQKVKNLIQKLGEAIHESVSESENIAGVVTEHPRPGIRRSAHAGGHHRPQRGRSSEPGEAADPATEAAIGPFTRNDLTFLKSLRITLPDSESEAHSNSLNIGSAADSADDPSADA